MMYHRTRVANICSYYARQNTHRHITLVGAHISGTGKSRSVARRMQFDDGTFPMHTFTHTLKRARKPSTNRASLPLKFFSPLRLCLYLFFCLFPFISVSISSFVFVSLSLSLSLLLSLSFHLCLYAFFVFVSLSLSLSLSPNSFLTLCLCLHLHLFYPHLCLYQYYLVASSHCH